MEKKNCRTFDFLTSFPLSNFCLHDWITHNISTSTPKMIIHSFKSRAKLKMAKWISWGTSVELILVYHLTNNSLILNYQIFAKNLILICPRSTSNGWYSRKKFKRAFFFFFYTMNRGYMSCLLFCVIYVKIRFFSIY